MRRHRERVPHEVAGLIALGLIAIAVFFAFGGSLPRSERTVKAVFRDTTNLKPGAPVRIAGVEAGKVAKVEALGPGERGATVTLRLRDNSLPLHRDAQLSIRPRLFLEGNFFVDLRPGTPASPELRDGATVPVNQTSTAVQLGDVLTALQSDTRADAQTTLRELGRALEDGGADAINRTLRWSAPAFRDTAVVMRAMQGTAPGDLPRLLRDGAQVAAALDENPAALRSLVADLDTTAAAFAREEDRLSATIAELPRLLRTAYPALAEVRDAIPPTRALAADARTGVREAPAALRAATPLLRELAGLASPSELGGVARDLTRAVPSLARLSRDTVPALRELRPAASCTERVLVPWSNDRIEDPAIPAAGTVSQELPKGLPGVAGESRPGDANGQWIRVLSTAGNYAYPAGADRFFTTTAPLMGVNPPKPARRPELRADVPCETQERPDLRTIPGNPPEGFKIDTGSPAARALETAAARRAGDWVRKLIRGAGLEDALKVGGAPLERAQVPKLRRAR